MPGGVDHRLPPHAEGGALCLSRQGVEAGAAAKLFASVRSLKEGVACWESWGL